ncbi:unnamed protein product [Spirodela intermedia]|uniref:peptidylprolyl isomerase n=1 Tax=Spirodela intermedia TaxID=51605 RepID=A0A7I8IQW1_SPIIN|nr:unnamed protein product [Spirodela intermedia]CAA6660319.1 unnamed protein product [Spirodela intermedia]
MASATASAYLPCLGSGFARRSSGKHGVYFRDKIQRPLMQCSASGHGAMVASSQESEGFTPMGRRSLIGASVLSSLSLSISDARGAGLPPEEKPKLCNDECEKELENHRFLLNLSSNYSPIFPAEDLVATNCAGPIITTESGLQYKDIKVGQGPNPPVGFQVVANYVAMVPSGQIFDSSLEKGLPYTFRVGSGQVIKGLDEGILSMKVGGRRRLYIPGSLAFPKGLTSAPGRPRVNANSPVVFDVSLEYIPGLEYEEE